MGFGEYLICDTIMFLIFWSYFWGVWSFLASPFFLKNLAGGAQGRPGALPLPTASKNAGGTQGRPGALLVFARDSLEQVWGTTSAWAGRNSQEKWGRALPLRAALLFQPLPPSPRKTGAPSRVGVETTRTVDSRAL